MHGRALIFLSSAMNKSRVVGFLIGILCAAGLTAWLGGFRSGSATHLISENTGALATVEIQFSAETADTTWPPIRDFLKLAGPDLALVAVCGNQSDAVAFKKLVAALGKAGPRQVETLVLGAPITGWSKDRFLVTSGFPATLLRPKDENSGLATRNNDAKIANLIAAKNPDRFRAHESKLAFDAGDVMAVNDDTIIVSDNISKKNGEPRNFEKELKNAFGARRVIWLHNVPDHHIGMFAAPLDDKTIVVGDPDWGKRLWNDKAAAKLGNPDMTDKATEPFREAARQLESAGFKVVRAPTLYMEPQVYLTYTNGVFERRNGKNIVYMPTYGIDSLDKAGEEAYRSAGWEVRPIRVEGVFRCRGTIGCLVNVLARR